MRRTLSLAVSALALAVSAAHAEPPFAFDSTPGKLPKTVVPSAYTIALHTDVPGHAFTAHVDIAVDVRSPTDTMVLDQVALTFSRAVLEDGTAATVTTDESKQTATLRFARAIAAGAHTLSIDYAGPIPLSPSGLYYNDYVSRGANKTMLVTQFESTDARRMFPGWDEPAFKATFQLTVDVPSAYTSISNMPAQSTTSIKGGMNRVVFARTPRMSTYLLALVAGEIMAVRGQAGGADMAVWAPAGREATGAYALSAEADILPYYNAYFGVPYPLPKLDLLAIPGNFAAGAMENWGAITFIDNDLLYDPATSSARTKEDVYLVVAHEMAHQWSGDLVTMAWWDDIWLNEGFATWMENKATDHFNPSWQIWPRQHADHEAAMALDARPTTHPIQVPIADESEIDNAFDRISYQKGSAVIRMIEDYLGADTFRDGMRRYMQKHRYSNTTSADLWAAMEAVSGKPVGAVAARFTEQPGIPLISVSTRCVANTALAVTLRQDRFTVHDPHPTALSWSVPVTLGAAGEAPSRTLVGGAPVTLQLRGCDTPVKVNLGENGYYRTQYDPAAYRRLVAAFPRLEAVDRANLAGDEYALAEAGRAPLTDWLALTRQLGHETNLAVWTDVLGRIDAIDVMERGDAERPAWRAYAGALVRPALDRLGWTPRSGESPLDAMLRPLLITTLGRMDDPATVAEARTLFAAYQANPASVSPGVLDAVCLVVGMHADAQTWEALRALGEHAADTEGKLRFLDAMGSARDPALFDRSVDYALQGALPNGRIGRYLVVVARNSDAPDAIWTRVVAMQEKLAGKMNVMMRARTLPYVASASNNPATAHSLLAQPLSNSSSGAKLAAKESADKIESDAELAARFRPMLAAWLQRRG